MGPEHLDTALRSRCALKSGNMEERVQLIGGLGRTGGEEGFVEVEEVSLSDGQVVIQDIEELSLHPPNVPHSESSGSI